MTSIYVRLNINICTTQHPSTSSSPPIRPTIPTSLHQLHQLLHLPPQRPDLQNRHISLDIRPGTLDPLSPAIALEIDLPTTRLLPLLDHVLIGLAIPPVPLDAIRLPLFQPGRHEEQGRVEDGHDGVVEALVAGGGEPPFEGEDEEEDLDEVEGWDEDVFVGRAHELQGLLGEERHVFVDGVVGDVGVGAIVEGDEDVEEDWGGLALGVA